MSRRLVLEYEIFEDFDTMILCYQARKLEKTAVKPMRVHGLKMFSLAFGKYIKSKFGLI